MTAIQTLIEVQKQFPPSDGWICKAITLGGGVRLVHPELGTRMCWLNGRSKRLRVIVKDITETELPDSNPS